MDDTSKPSPTPPAAPVMATPPPIPVDAYYDSAINRYMVVDGDENWMKVDTQGLKLRLALKGLRNKATKHEVISPADAMVVRVQNERHVHYSGGLAGYKRGVHTINGAKVLVTHSPKLIEARPGEWGILKRVIDQQLSPRTPQEPDQWTYFNGCVKMWEDQLRRCLETGRVSWSLVLILTGPKGCGKTLLQQIITEILGGRNASPFKFMMGRTEFNHELFQSEHLCIMDEQPSTDIRQRVAFGEAIKQIAANPGHAYYGKNKDGRTLRPFWRLTISANDEHDHLEVLPPLDDIDDKAVVLSCRKEPMPMPTSTPEEEAAFWNVLMQELPCYLHWLRNEFVIPEEFRANRYGLKSFVHPHVRQMLEDLAPETRLLALIDHVLFMDGRKEWHGTAEELSRQLMDSMAYGKQATQLVTNSITCGRLLAKLARTKPKRVEEQRTASCRGWLLNKPEEPMPPMSQEGGFPDDYLKDVLPAPPSTLPDPQKGQTKPPCQ